MCNPKHSAKYVCCTGTSALSTARADTSCEMERRRTRSSSSTLSISSRFPWNCDPTGTATGRSRGITSTSSRISQRRNAKKENSCAFTIGSSVIFGSEKPCWNWVALKKQFARWTKWRTRTTHTLLQKKNSTYTVAIGGYVRILLVPTRCPWGIVLISKKRCQLCVALRMERIKFIIKIGGKVLPRLGGTGKILGGIPHLRHHRDDGLNTDGAGEPVKTVNGLFIRGMSVKTNLVKSYSDQFGNSQRSLLSPTGVVKSFPPKTENWLRKRYHYSMNNDTSTEDKHKTNHINNKCNDMNMNTRKMHIT